jgi:cell division inhibitor SepF
MSTGLWYRTLVYLGLKEEPEDGYEVAPARTEADADAHRTERFDPVGDPDARPRAAVAPAGDPDVTDSNVRRLRLADRSRPRTTRLALVDVAAFEDVESVGSRYRDGQPVLFDVGPADGATARRVVDFVAGLTYALEGRMHKVGSRAFLLVPEGVELPDAERRRVTTLGYQLPTGSE